MSESNQIAQQTLKCLNQIHKKDTSNIVEILKSKHYLESIVISILNYQRINNCKVDINKKDDVTLVLKSMHSLKLLSKKIVDFWEDYFYVIQLDDFGINSVPDNDINVLREELLTFELSFSGDEIFINCDKITRDKSGSYYTPQSIATEAIQEGIDRYILDNQLTEEIDIKNALSKCLIADLSCGCGDFFLSFIQVLNQNYDISPKDIVTNLYGADIDPIARQVAICNLLVFTEKRYWKQIISNITLGNPLIDRMEETSNELKVDLFAIGRYYSRHMGINLRNSILTIKFDIIIGNPPWEKIRFEERKFFKQVDVKIANIPQKSKRKEAIENIKTTHMEVYNLYIKLCKDYSDFKEDIKNNPFITHSLSGELNTYSLFTELAFSLLSAKGILTILIKTSLLTSPVNKPLFGFLTQNEHLRSICLFDNKKKIFDIDSREKFSILSCGKSAKQSFQIKAGLIDLQSMRDVDWIDLTQQSLQIINPLTNMLPNISNNEDIIKLLTIHKDLPLFKEVYPNCRFGRLVHLTTHSNFINTMPSSNNIPIYEGKFIEQYNARFSTFEGLSDLQKYSSKAQAKKNDLSQKDIRIPESRYFIDEDFWNKINTNYRAQYMLCWRSLTSTTNKKTTIAMILPFMPTCQSIQFLQNEDTKELVLLLALFNSLSFDNIVKLKMPGIDLTQSVINQIPVPNKEIYFNIIEFRGITNTLENHIITRALYLLKEESMLYNLIEELIHSCGPLQGEYTDALEEINELFEIAYRVSINN